MIKPTCHELIGQTIQHIDLAGDGGAIRFTLADGVERVWLADGDCCSHSWIEAIDDVGALIGGTVTATEDLELPQQDLPDGYVRQFYGVKITTEKGRATIDYRNDSNGYYGGDLVPEGSRHFYGGVYEQNVSTREWRRLG